MRNATPSEGMGPRRVAILIVATSSLVACEPPAAEPPPPASTTDQAASTSAPPEESGRRGYEIPIPQLEYWAGTTVPKYRYEMRFDPPDTPGGPPKLHRNGWASAYYGSGSIEREGAYRYTAANGRSERVGIWTYYTQDGQVDRTEDRGGEVVWTAPDQRIAPPGTTP